MYFESREEAGIKLAILLFEKYRYENCAVVSLTDGGVIVGEQIASALHSILTMMIIEKIEIPGERMSFGAVSQEGSFSYDSSISQGEMDEYTNEYHGYIEEKKREAFQKINRLLGDGGLIDREMLRDHVVILVSDGMNSSAELDAAMDFLKPIRIARLVIAAPVASVEAIDKLHMIADELHILDVKDNYLDTNHYYNRNILPSHEETVAKINKIVLNWR
jgi:predicted phosphoribosyltransferase